MVRLIENKNLLSVLFFVSLLLILFVGFTYRHYAFSEQDLNYSCYPVPFNWDTGFHSSLAFWFLTSGDAVHFPPYWTGGRENMLLYEPPGGMLAYSLIAQMIPLPPYEGIFFAQVLLLILMIGITYGIASVVFDRTTAILAAALAAVPAFVYLQHLYYGLY
jgi:hypothetical protein